MMEPRSHDDYDELHEDDDVDDDGGGADLDVGVFLILSFLIPSMMLCSTILSAR